MPGSSRARGLLGAGRCGPARGPARPRTGPVGQGHLQPRSIPGCRAPMLSSGMGAAATRCPASPQSRAGALRARLRGEPAPGRLCLLGTVNVLLRRHLPLPAALCSASALCPAPDVLPRGVHSRWGAHRGAEAEPPRGRRGPSHVSLRSHRGFAKFLSATFPRSRLEPLPPARSLRVPPPPPLLAGQGQNCQICLLRDGRAPRPVGLGASGAFTRALAFPLLEPQRSVWSPGAAELVPEENRRAGKGATLPGKWARQHIKRSCSFLPCVVRKSTQIIKNIYTLLSWKRRVISGFIINYHDMASPGDGAEARELLSNHPGLKCSRRGVRSRVRPVSPLPAPPLRAGTCSPEGPQPTGRARRHPDSLGRGIFKSEL